MKYILLLTILFMQISCAEWKQSLVKKGNQNDAVHNAIVDFLHTSKLSKQDTVFSIRIEQINNEMIGVVILGNDENKIFPDSTNQIGSNRPGFPTRYKELNGKLFTWYDSTNHVTRELVSVLSKYNHVDSLNVNGFKEIPPYLIDDSKEAMDYYFCKSNLLKYKKVRTSITMGWYDSPNLKCNK